jgi:hypothetical protein
MQSMRIHNCSFSTTMDICYGRAVAGGTVTTLNYDKAVTMLTTVPAVTEIVVASA